jgi:hypothetical protein
MFFIGLNGFAQKSTPDSLESYFAKPSVSQQQGDVFFNVIRIVNHSDSAIHLTPMLDIPDGWALFSTSLTDTVVKPNETISLSFSIRVATRAHSSISHRIFFYAYSNKNKVLCTTSFNVQLEAVHKWDVVMPDDRVFFCPGTDEVQFEVKIVNQGNVKEVISLDIQPDKKISLLDIRRSDFKQEIELAANHDTSIVFRATYDYPEDRIFDVGKVQLYASTDNHSVYRIKLIEKYSDNYTPFDIDQKLMHETELGVRSFSNNDKVYPFIRARGAMEINDESNFRYNFTHYDLTETENLIGNTYYNFLYSRKSFNAGIGAFSSQLGRNLYSRNGIMVSDALPLSPSSTVEGYLSYSFISPKTSAALGYRYEKEDFIMLGSAAYDVDSERKINTASLVYNLNKLALHKNHFITAVLYGYHEYHYTNQKFIQAGIAWDLNYFGNIGERFNYQVTNNYGSPDIPGNQKGLLNFLIKAKYLTGDKKKYFTTKYQNASRDYYNMNYAGQKFPNVLLKDQYANFLYNSNVKDKYKWSLGPSLELYQSSKPITNPDGRIEFSIRKLRLEYRAFIGRNLVVNLKNGLSYFQFLEPVAYEYNKYDFHLQADYSKNGYGLRLTYDYGPMVNTGLYQYSLDAGNNTLNVSPYAIKSYLRGRMALTMFTNYTYRFDMEYGSININPKLESYIFRNWYFVVGGTYNFTHQKYKEQEIYNSSYYLEFSIKKKWGKSYKPTAGKKLIRLKVIAFQDENANGIKDKAEAGIPNVKIRIKLQNIADQRVMESLPYDFTLLTNEDGGVIFNSIPIGFYDLVVNPLEELKEYFFVSQSVERLELFEKSTYYIPFQKASKIYGQVLIQRRKFIAEDEKGMDVQNVRITAYNKQGDSYTAFTDQEGRFVIFAPGNNTYYLRMENVFGADFKILHNDIPAVLSDSTSGEVVFNVAETNRQLRIKKADPVAQNSAKSAQQKLKVLSGDLYEKTGEVAVDKNATPEFDITPAPVEEQIMISGKFYVVVGEVKNLKSAIKYKKLMAEQGINTYIGLTNKPNLLYVYTNHYQSKAEAKAEVNLMTKVGLESIWVVDYKE